MAECFEINLDYPIANSGSIENCKKGKQKYRTAKQRLRVLAGMHQFVQHPANIGQASAPFGIFFGTAAGPKSFLGSNFLQNHGASVYCIIRLDIVDRVSKTKADRFTHVCVLGHF
jgi:hypothetical protein